MSRRARTIVAVLVALIFVLFISARGIASFYTDYLWFDSLNYASVWSGVLLTQVLLAVVFIALMIAMTWVSLYLADRFAPEFRPAGPEEEFVRRYHETIGSKGWMVNLGASVVFGILWGWTASARWKDWILFRNRQDFGVKDPQFDTDVGFYVFTLPFVQFLLSWFFTAFVIILTLTAASAYLNGGIRINHPTERVTPQVKGHISVLLAILAIIKAIDYWYQRYALTISDTGVVSGASNADINARLPAIQLLILISICAAGLLILNIFRRGWVLPAAAVGLWAFVAIVVGSIFPAFFQRVFVLPSESTREAELIERNISATRAAYGMTDEDVTTTRVSPNFSADGLTRDLFLDNRQTIENIRILDPDIAAGSFAGLQAEREIYRFPENLDVDRYVVDGEVRPVVIAGRELNLAGAREGWENQHIENTHGFGSVVALANETLDDGRPDFLVEGLGLPPQVIIDERLEVNIDQQRLYIGEGLSGYAIVGTDRAEVDYPTGGARAEGDEEVGTNRTFNYDGADGVDVGGFIRRVAFGIRFGDWDPVFSGLINADSKILYNRDVKERVKELAPFLSFDCDPYPVLLDGRTLWVVDAFTTTGRYPFSQPRDLGSVPAGCDLRQDFNYIRNSVKAVVDAYDGTVTFYIVDNDDPIVAAYAKAFPDLFESESAMPAGLQEHLRYPEDLFRIQTDLWGRYQLTESNDFFSLAGAWTVAPDPGVGLNNTNSSSRIPPYYVQGPLPGASADEQEFLLMRPFVPNSTDDSFQELTALMYVRNDPGKRGELVVYQATDQQFDGPLLANDAMLIDDIVARETTLLGQKGSNVALGNMLLVPLDEANWIWVRPLFVVSDQNIPELSFVIVYFGDEVRMCPTLNGALSALFISQNAFDATEAQCQDTLFNDSVRPGDTSPPDTDEPGSTEDLTPAELIGRANEKFAEANAARLSGDLGEYQRLVDEGIALNEQADELLNGPEPERSGGGTGDDPETDGTTGDNADGDAGEGESEDAGEDGAETEPTPEPTPGEA